jgi:hypothetical protein
MRSHKAIWFGVCFTLIASCALFLEISKTPQTAAAESKMDRKPVIVELFTSEGCSSCPPADLLLQKLVAQQPVAGAEIIALEEHVDYWNHLGWADPYSSPEWTQRQQDYTAFFHNDPYTPQAVVDGRKDFVGNNSRDASQAIENAAHEAKADVAITLEPADAKGLQHIAVSVGKTPGNISGDVAEIWLAVTEDGLHSSVSRGENAGRQLTHIATLRSLRKIGTANSSDPAVSFHGVSSLKLDSKWNLENIRVTVFVQRKRGREILGAASTKW